MSESKAASTSDSELVCPLPTINVLREIITESQSSTTDESTQEEKQSYNDKHFPPALDFYTLNQIDVSQRTSRCEPELAQFHEKVSRLEIPEINRWLKELHSLLPSLRLQLHRYGRIRKALDIGLDASRQNRSRAMAQLAALEAGTCNPSTVYYPQLVQLRDLINLEADFIETDYVDQVAAHTDVATRIVHAMIMILRLPNELTDLATTPWGESCAKPTEWETAEDAILAASTTPDNDSLEKHYETLLNCSGVLGLPSEIEAGIADEPFYDASDMSPSKFNIQLPVIRIPVTCAGMKALRTYVKLVDCMGYADLRIIRYLRCDPRVLKFNITKEWLYPMDSIQPGLHCFPTYGVSRMFMETGFVPICGAQDYYATRIDRCYAARADDNIDPRIPLCNLRLVVWAKLLESLGEGVLGSLQRLMISVASSRYPTDNLTYTIGKLKGSLTTRGPVEFAKVLNLKAVDHDPVALTMLDNLMYLCQESGFPRSKGSCYPQAVEYGYIVAERRFAGVCADGYKNATEKSKELYERLVERKHLTGISNVGLSASTPVEKMKYFLQACDYTNPDHFAAAGYYAMDVFNRSPIAFPEYADRTKLSILMWRAALAGHYNAVQFFISLLNEAPVEAYYWRTGYRILSMSPTEAVRVTRELMQRGTPLLTEHAKNMGSILTEGNAIQTPNPLTNMLIGAMRRDDNQLKDNTQLYGARHFSKESVCREVAAIYALVASASTERTQRTFDYGAEIADIKDRTMLEIHARFTNNSFALGLMFERGLIPPSSKLFSDVKELCDPRIILDDAVTLSLAISCYTVALEKDKDRRAAYRLAVLFSRLSTADQVANTRVCKKLISKLAKSSGYTCIEWLAAYTAMDKTSSHELTQCLQSFRSMWMNDPQRRWPHSDEHLDLAYSLMPHVDDEKWSQETYLNTLVSQITKLSERMLIKPDWIRSNDETKAGDEQPYMELAPKWWAPRYLSADAQKKMIADAKLREEKKTLDPYTPRPPQTQGSYVTTVLYPDLVPMAPVFSTTLLNSSIPKPVHSSRGLTQPLGLATFVLGLRSLATPKRISLLKSYRKYIAEEFGDSLEDGVGWATVDAAQVADGANTTSINADAVDVIVKKLLDEHRVLVRAPYLFVMAKRKKTPLPLIDELSILAIGFHAKCPFATKELLTLRSRILALVGHSFCNNAQEPDQQQTQGRIVLPLPVESQLPAAGDAEGNEADDLRHMFISEGINTLDAIVSEVKALITDATQANVPEVVATATSLLREFVAFSAASKKL